MRLGGKWHPFDTFCYNLETISTVEICLPSEVHAQGSIVCFKHPIQFMLHRFIDNFNLRYDGFTAILLFSLLARGRYAAREVLTLACAVYVPPCPVS